MQSAVLKAVQETVEQLPWKLVVHLRPDTDAYCCLWAADRFIVPEGAPRSYMFVEAGERLPDEECHGLNVLHMDTGGGDFDQHGKNLKRASSFALLAEAHPFGKDPAIQMFVEWTKATDNVEKMAFTDVNYILKGLAHEHATGEGVDWAGAIQDAFKLLDILYAQSKQRVKAREEYKSVVRETVLHNKVGLATIFWRPDLRETAYDAGADVALWTIRKGKGIHVGVQVSRDSNVTLHQVACALRKAEAKKRGMEISDEEALKVGGNDSAIPTWFLHDSGKLIVAGSRSHPLSGDECTKLKPEEIFRIVGDALAKFRFHRN